MSSAPPVSANRPTIRTLLTLAWPVVVSRSTQSVIGMADALMVAQLGAAALASASTGAINTFSVIILPMGTVFIVQSFAAQFLGQGDLASARRFAWYGLVVAGLAQVLAVAATPLVGPALGLFGYPPDVLALMTQYMVIRLWSTGAFVATEALGNWFGGLGDTQVHMRASILTMVANIVLNWMFIFGNWGAPRLGVAGAALASSLATLLGAIFIGYAFHLRQREMAVHGRVRLRWDEFLRVLRFGLPNGVNWFMELSAFTLFLNAVVSSLGTVVLAALNAILQLNSVSFMPAFGIASAGAILAGQAIGRGDRDLVPGILWLTMRVMLLWQGSVGLIYLLMPGALMGLFAAPGAESAELVRIGTLLLMLSAAWQIFDAVGLAVGESLRAAGDTAWCMWARLLSAWAVFLPCAWLLVRVMDGGPAMVMLSIILYLALLAAALALRFRSGAWRRIALTGQPPLHP